VADHLDAPGLQPPLGDVMTDITDVYAFLKPDDDSQPPGKSILVMNVNPLTLGAAFDTTADYLLNIDTNGNAAPDITFRTRFTTTPGGNQMATVERISPAGTEVVIANAPVSGASETRISVNGPYKFFAGVRSDPFFFDLLGFLNNFQFTGSDFFAARNVFGIVLEVPNKALGSNPSATSIWGRTRIPVNGVVSNGDRMGRAGINTVFNHGPDKNIFNSLDPAQDQTAMTSEGITFLQSFTNTLVTLSNLGGHAGYTEGQAMAIAEILLPDMLTYNFSKPTSYAQLNGRRLQDDVIDISLNLVTRGLLTGDGVGPHTDYLDHFPYLGNPH
jgi:hypothetical protein